MPETEWNFEDVRVIDSEDMLSYHRTAPGEDADFGAYPQTGYGCEWELAERPMPTGNHSHYSVLLDDMPDDIVQCGAEAMWCEVSERHEDMRSLCSAHALLSIANAMESPTFERVEGAVRITTEE